MTLYNTIFGSKVRPKPTAAKKKLNNKRRTNAINRIRRNAPKKHPSIARKPRVARRSSNVPGFSVVNNRYATYGKPVTKRSRSQPATKRSRSQPATKRSKSQPATKRTNHKAPVKRTNRKAPVKRTNSQNLAARKRQVMGFKNQIRKSQSSVAKALKQNEADRRALLNAQRSLCAAYAACGRACGARPAGCLR